MNITTKAWRETLIDNLLRSIRFRSSAYFRARASRAMGLQYRC